jgi:hypothetical protein
LTADRSAEEKKTPALVRKKKKLLPFVALAVSSAVLDVPEVKVIDFAGSGERQ